MKLTRLKYFIIYVILLVLPLSFVAIASYFIPSLNHLAFKTYYLYYGGMSLSFTSIFVLGLTHFLIKHNFKEDNRQLDNKYLLKINLIFIIFYILLTTISNVLAYFNVPAYFNFVIYFFYPLFYFCIILFLEHEKLNKKSVITILLSVYLLWYLLVPLVTFIFNNRMALREIATFKSLAYVLLAEYLKYSLLIMPFLSLGLIKISNEDKEKSVVHKYNFSIKKLFIVAAVLLAIAIAVILVVNR